MPLFVWSVCRYFVIANAIAAAYNLLVLLVRRRRTTAGLVVRMLDMVMIAFFSEFDKALRASISARVHYPCFLEMTCHCHCPKKLVA